MRSIRPKGPEETRISIENEQNTAEIGESQIKLLERTALACLTSENIPIGCEINITISDDNDIRRINREFRKLDRSTDVLSFPLVHMHNGRILSAEGDIDPDKGLLMLGDIVISIETAISQARQFGHSLERELAFLTSHGVFHLLGYDHMEKEEENVMMSKQEAILDRLGLKRT